MSVKYREFIEDNFMITTTSGVVVPFVFNDVQAYFYDLITKEYGAELEGVRENILKSRRFGFSSIIDAMFAVKFILGELGEIPTTNSAVYSYKVADTQTLFRRVNQFIDSWLLKSQGGDYRDVSHRAELPRLRTAFLQKDVSGNEIIGKNNSEYHCLTAGAKVSGRGGTFQNIHWSEVAFYGNTAILDARQLVTGAEEQVSTGVGMIFRETTGNVADDMFSSEYRLGKEGKSDFKSRFLAWHLFGNYTKKAPEGWEPPDYYDFIRSNGVTDDQCFWHFEKTRGLTDKLRMREYPTTDVEAFLLGGEGFFTPESLIAHMKNIIEPIKEVQYAASL